MTTFKTLLILAVLGVAAGAGLIYSGVYNIGADSPHWPLTFKLIQSLRERSIGSRAKGIEVPNLDDPKLIGEGAEHYSAMCSGCHLAPGMEDTEIRAGLYPQPPNLVEHKHAHGQGDATASAARQFWIIKHGIKMTAMPAWGATHGDDSIWGLVAFLQKLPGMTPGEYAALTGAAGSHDHGSGHSHGAAEGGIHSNHQHGAEAVPDGHVDAHGALPHSHDQPRKDEESHEEHSHAD